LQKNWLFLAEIIFGAYYLSALDLIVMLISSIKDSEEGVQLRAKEADKNKTGTTGEDLEQMLPLLVVTV